MNEAAKKRALSLVEKRDYSRKMLVDKLTEKGATDEEAAEVADWLCSLGVIDDERYAGLVVRHYARKGYGPRRIKEELFRRGIDRELWENSLAQLPDADDTVYHLLSNKLRGSSAPEDMERARNYLLRRGYSWEEVRGALEHYQAENEEQE